MVLMIFEVSIYHIVPKLNFMSLEEDLIEQKITERGIKYIGRKENEEKEYVPFDGGYIHEEDGNYIKENSVKASEIARYVDGWYSCLPFPQFYNICDLTEVKEDYPVFGRKRERYSERFGRNPWKRND